MTTISNPSASITNALIRCTRKDTVACSAFELVRDDIGLWVLELDFADSEIWASQLNTVCDQIEIHRGLLASLCSDSSDFTLHLAVAADETLPLRIPVRMSQLAAECGLEIEIYVATRQAERRRSP